MGVVSSCLGLDRRNNPENPETSRLLDNDSQQSAYGGIGPSANHSAHHIDPQAVERDRKALEAIVEYSSDNLIDLFALKHQHAYAAAPESKANQLGRRMGQIALLQDSVNRQDGDVSDDLCPDGESANQAEEDILEESIAVEETAHDLLGEPPVGKGVLRGIRSR